MQQTPKTAAEYQAEMMQLYRRAHPETEVPPTPAAEPPAPEIHAVPEISMPPVAPEVPPEPVPEPVSEPQPMPEMPERRQSHFLSRWQNSNCRKNRSHCRNRKNH